MTVRKSRDGAWGWAYGFWKLKRSVRLDSTRPWLADGNAHAIGAQIAEPENPAAGRGADDPHLGPRPIAEHLLDPSPVFERQVHAPRAPEDMPKFEAGLADSRVVHDGQETGGVGHHHPVEERLIGIEQPDSDNGPPSSAPDMDRRRLN